MPFEVVLPRLGWNMESGSLGEWLKKDGDVVEAGEMLFTVEGDKATQEIEALEGGILRIPPESPPSGEVVLVGTLLAYLLQPGEEMPVSRQEPTVTEPSPAEKSETRTESAAPAIGTSGSDPAVSPRARRVAAELGVDWTRLAGSGRTGRIVERDVRAAAAVQSPSEARISPLARRIAEDMGVDVAALGATQPGRRIGKAEVEAAARGAAPAPVGALRRLPITQTRRTIADRMATSAHTAAQVTLTTEVDATELVTLRRVLKSQGSEPVPTYNDLMAKLCAEALLAHPALNARLEANEIVQWNSAHIGIAVDTERGLLVPVVRDVQAKSVREVATASAALIERVRAGKAAVDDFTGGTFTITNLGMYEIDGFTPIINLPECAILGVGRIVPKQVVVDAEAERVAIRHMMFLSLTFDHRLVDGAPAARFLQTIKRFVETPYLWLVN